MQRKGNKNHDFLQKFQFCSSCEPTIHGPDQRLTSVTTREVNWRMEGRKSCFILRHFEAFLDD